MEKEVYNGVVAGPQKITDNAQGSATAFGSRDFNRHLYEDTSEVFGKMEIKDICSCKKKSVKL